jgi:hypothetical protein
MAYRAYGAKGSFSLAAKTARRAAEAFFEAHPSRRKCNVIQGVSEGGFFTTAYTRGNWPLSYKDVTRQTVASLPDVEDKGE